MQAFYTPAVTMRSFARLCPAHAQARSLVSHPSPYCRMGAACRAHAGAFVRATVTQALIEKGKSATNLLNFGGAGTANKPAENAPARSSRLRSEVA